MPKRFFSELYPVTAAHFGCDVPALVAWENELSLHGWTVPSQLWSYADALMSLTASWRERDNLFHSSRFVLLLSTFVWEYHKMTKRQTRDSRVQRADWKGFLDYRLSETELAQLDEWAPPLGEVWEMVDKLLTDNYRVTLSYNKQFGVASCTILDDDPGRRTGGYGLASSDADGAMALKAALHKHFNVLGGTWDKLLDEPLTKGRRG